jgi:CPA2 family monovalent cation:H+ antiporter-2
MFGVGLHFSLKDLLSVRAIALPGAIAQIAVATLMGMGLAFALGWHWAQGFVFGLALSTASTVVLLRAMQERRLLDTERGHIAVGWLIVEDLAMVVALVLLPALAEAMGGNGAAAGTQSGGDFLKILGITVGKVAAFIALMLIVGRRVIPWILHYIAHTGTRELFRLAVLALALGTAYAAATLFGVSFALGAFFAGMILAESELSKQAANETLPLRDAFAVLFFVSVGMLFDPKIVIEQPLPLLATIAIIMFGKSLAAYVIVRLFGHPTSTALTISASLAQIGEFSFILAGLGVALGLLPEEGRDLILAGAIISIMLNPLVFAQMERLAPHRPQAAGVPGATPAENISVTNLINHAIVIGYGRVGSLVGAGLGRARWPFLAIEEIPELAEAARRDGGEVILGNAAKPEVLKAANPGQARVMFVAIPQAFEAGQIVAQARTASPGLKIIARAHSDAEVEHLTKYGASLTIMGEREIAQGMLEEALPSLSPGTPPELTIMQVSA